MNGSTNFFFFNFQVIDTEVSRNIMLALACVMFCTTILILNPNICFWIFMCVVLTLVNFENELLYLTSNSLLSMQNAFIRPIDKCLRFNGSMGLNNRFSVVHRIGTGGRSMRRLRCSRWTHVFSHRSRNKIRASIKYNHTHCAGSSLWRSFNTASSFNVGQFRSIHFPGIFQSKLSVTCILHF